MNGNRVGGQFLPLAEGIHRCLPPPTAQLDEASPRLLTQSETWNQSLDVMRPRSIADIFTVIIKRCRTHRGLASTFKLLIFKHAVRGTFTLLEDLKTSLAPVELLKKQFIKYIYIYIFRFYWCCYESLGRNSFVNLVHQSERLLNTLSAYPSCKGAH